MVVASQIPGPKIQKEAWPRPLSLEVYDFFLDFWADWESLHVLETISKMEDLEGETIVAKWARPHQLTAAASLVLRID